MFDSSTRNARLPTRLLGFQRSPFDPRISSLRSTRRNRSSQKVSVCENIRLTVTSLCGSNGYSTVEYPFVGVEILTPTSDLGIPSYLNSFQMARVTWKPPFTWIVFDG